MGKVNKFILLLFLFSVGHSFIANADTARGMRRDYTVLDARAYERTLTQSRQEVKKILAALRDYRSKPKDSQIAFIVQQLLNKPYLYNNAMGEGDWQPSSTVYRPGAVHVQQQPVYRLDGFNCQTFVQTAMALLYSHNLREFDKNYLKIAYGAAGNPYGEIVRYYNRNNFVDADFNPVNQHHGWLRDVSAKGPLAKYTATTSALITRQNWFIKQQQNLAENVQVLDTKQGPAMAKRFTTVYSQLKFPHFISQQITLHYLPKETLVLRQADGRFKPNEAVLNQLPTPAVVEIVRDIKKWDINGIKIQDIIGSELTVSHLGLLYKQSFHAGELIYDRTTCVYDQHNQYNCFVVPVVCQKTKCTEQMFAHATAAYPTHFFWYQQSNGKAACSSQRPQPGTPYLACNRVVTLPLFAYLTEFNGYYYSMESPSLLGLHLEQLI